MLVYIVLRTENIICVSGVESILTSLCKEYILTSLCKVYMQGFIMAVILGTINNAAIVDRYCVCLTGFIASRDNTRPYNPKRLIKI